MSELPRDLWGEILLRLPFKDLIRFRCVSPSFRHVIDCPIFRRRHFTLSPDSLILSSKSSSFALPLDSIPPDEEPLHARVVKLKHPVPPGHAISCSPFSDCGLVLLHDVKQHELYVWNPLTGGRKCFPLRGITGVPYFVGANYGMGFDPSFGEFKVVVIRHCCSYDTGSRRPRRWSDVVMCRMSDGNPVVMAPLSYDVCDKKSFGVSVAGALHWLVRLKDTEERETVLGVDLETGNHRIVPLPQCGDCNYELELCVLGGCLTVSWWSHNCQKFEAWSMMEYGVVGSWRKLYDVHSSDPGLHISFWGVRPVAYSNCGNQILLALDMGLAWYHLKNKTVKLIKLQGWGNVRHFTTTAYAGSFIPMDCDNLKLETPSTMQRKRKSKWGLRGNSINGTSRILCNEEHYICHHLIFNRSYDLKLALGHAKELMSLTC